MQSNRLPVPSYFSAMLSEPITPFLSALAISSHNEIALFMKHFLEYEANRPHRDVELTMEEGGLLGGLPGFIKEERELLLLDCPTLISAITGAQLSQNDLDYLKRIPNGFKDLVRSGTCDANKITYKTGGTQAESEAPRKAASIVAKANITYLLLAAQLTLSQSAGHAITAATTLMSRFFGLNGMTKQGLEVLSKLRFICSGAKAEIYSVASEAMVCAKATVKKWTDSDDVIAMIHYDNYVRNRWNSTSLSAAEKKEYTISDATCSVIVKFLPMWNPNWLMNKSEENIANNRSTMPVSIDNNTIRKLTTDLQTGKISGLGSIMENLQMTEEARLDGFVNLPSMDNRSSSKADTMTQVMGGLLHGIFHVDKKEAMFGADPEPQNIIAEFACVAPESVMGIILPLSVFHLNESTMKALYSDPAFFILILLPLLRHIGYRPTTLKKMEELMIAALKNDPAVVGVMKEIYRADQHQMTPTEATATQPVRDEVSFVQDESVQPMMQRPPSSSLASSSSSSSPSSTQMNAPSTRLNAQASGSTPPVAARREAIGSASQSTRPTAVVSNLKCGSV